MQRDEHPRPSSTLEQLAGLKPIFADDGTVTAGNSSGLNDGAAALLVMSERRASALGLKPLARIAAYASAGVDPMEMGLGPVPASRRALQRAGWSVVDLDLVELNEAFAAQAIAVNREMQWDTDIVNVNGGAIALGHPLGGSGARIVVTLLHEKCNAAASARASPPCASAAAKASRSAWGDRGDEMDAGVGRDDAQPRHSGRDPLLRCTSFRLTYA